MIQFSVGCAEPDIALYAIHQPFYEPINPVREKRKAITPVVPEFPEVQIGSWVIALGPELEIEDEEMDDGAGSDEESGDDSDSDAQRGASSADRVDCGACDAEHGLASIDLRSRR